MFKQMRYEVIDHNPAAAGRSTIDIECPFCGEEATAFLWSLAGGGKKCVCGALMTNDGIATKGKE